MNAGFYSSVRTIHCSAATTDALYIKASSDSDLDSSGDSSGPAAIYGDASVYFRVHANRHSRLNVKAHKDYSAGFF